MKSLNDKRVVVFDGNQSELYNKEFHLKLNGKSIQFRVNDFEEDFSQLKEIVGPETLQSLILDLELSELEYFPEEYESKEGLSSSFCIFKTNEENILIIISSGERQPSRFFVLLKVYLSYKKDFTGYI